MSKLPLIILLFILIGMHSAHSQEFDSPLTPTRTAGQRAFPTAEGWGAVGIGGRGGSVIHITNLNDTGAGSLRDALEVQTGPRTVVFDVGGIINLSTNIEIAIGDGFITIAGQTAPGDGVCLRGGTIAIEGTDVIIRHLCLRRGDGPGDTRSNGDGIKFGHAQRSIVDHISVSWSIDESMGISFSDTNDISVQYSLFYEPLDGTIEGSNPNHAFGPYISNEAKRISFHNNVIAHVRQRSPQLSNVQDIDVVNNIIFNWENQGTRISDNATSAPSTRINVINNVFRTGSNTDSPPIPMQIRDLDANAKVYFGGNTDEAGTPLTAVDVRTSDPAALIAVPNPRPGHALINRIPASQVWATLLNKVGARVPTLDAADALLIAQIQSGAGTIVDCVDLEDQSQTILIVPCVIESALGSYPVYAAVTRCACSFDADGDGMSDAWEVAHGLNPTDPADRNADMVGDGWTNLEYYLNQLAGDYG